MSSAWVGGTKTPPYSVHAEKALLGSVLVEPKMLSPVKRELPSADAFFREQHGWLYDVLLELQRKRRPIDLDAVADALEADEHLERLGGRAYLVELTGVATDKAHAVAHAKHVFDKARLRELIEAASELLTEAYRGAKDVDEIIAHARARLDDLVPETA